MALNTLGPEVVAGHQPIDQERLYGGGLPAGQFSVAAKPVVETTSANGMGPGEYWLPQEESPGQVATDAGAQTAPNAVIEDRPTIEEAQSEWNSSAAMLAERVALMQEARPDVVFGEQTPAAPFPAYLGLEEGRYLVLTSDPELYFGLGVQEGDVEVRMLGETSDHYAVTQFGLGDDQRRTYGYWSTIPGRDVHGLIRVEAGTRVTIGSYPDSYKSQLFSVRVPDESSDEGRSRLFFGLNQQEGDVEVIGVVGVVFPEDASDGDDAPAADAVTTHVATAAVSTEEPPAAYEYREVLATQVLGQRIEVPIIPTDGSGFDYFGRAVEQPIMLSAAELDALAEEAAAEVAAQEEALAVLTNGESRKITTNDGEIEQFTQDGCTQALLAVFSGEGGTLGTISRITSDLDGHQTPLFVFSRLTQMASELDPNAPPVFRPTGVLRPDGVYEAAVAEAEGGESARTYIQLAADGSEVELTHAGYGATNIRVDRAAGDDLLDYRLRWQLPSSEIVQLLSDALRMAQFGARASA